MLCLSTSFPALADLNAYAADILVNQFLPLEFLEFFKAYLVPKISGIFLNRLAWAALNTECTLAASILRWGIDLKRHIGQDRDKAKLAAEFLIHQKVVPAYPAKSGKVADSLMGEVGLLVLPVYNLGGRDRQGIKAIFLDVITGPQGG